MIIILVTIILGLFISLITLPLGYYAPEWILLIVIYWAIAVPSNNKLFLAFFDGNPSRYCIWSSARNLLAFLRTTTVYYSTTL